MNRSLFIMGKNADLPESPKKATSYFGISLFALVLAACTTSSTSAQTPTQTQGGNKSTPIVTPSEIPQILKSANEKNNLNNQTLSIPGQGQIETGTALALDDAFFKMQKLAGSKSVTGANYIPFYYSLKGDSIPYSSHYPAHFLAMVSLTSPANSASPAAACPNSDSATLFEFVKSSPNSNWKVALEPFTNGSTSPKFATLKDGYSAPLNPKTKLVLPLAQIPATFAQALQIYGTSGRITGGLAKSDFSTTGCWSVFDFHQGYTFYKSASIAPTLSIAPVTPSDVVTFPLTKGAVLELFSLRFVYNLRPATATGSINQQTQRGNPYSYTLPAGQYSSVSQPGICELAVVDPPNSINLSRSTQPQLVGADCGELMASGQKASKVTTVNFVGQ